MCIRDRGYIAPFIERRGLFNGVGVSERPDTVCGKISEGRIAIIVDGTPNVLIVPHLFIENFQTFDDYATRPFFATFTRWLKVFAFFLSIFLPGFYVASGTFHPEFLPQVLLTKVVQAQAETPFSLMIECIMIHIIYEILSCLLYTSDAADDTPCVDLGGRRIIKKIFFSSRRRHTRLAAVSWARRCV